MAASVKDLKAEIAAVTKHVGEIRATFTRITEAKSASVGNKRGIQLATDFLTVAQKAFDMINQMSINQENIIESISKELASAIKSEITTKLGTMSFADVLKTNLPKPTFTTTQSSKPVENPPSNNLKTIIISSKDPSTLSAAVVQTTVEQKINNNKQRKLKITNKFNTNEGIGLVCASQHDHNHIINELKVMTGMDDKCNFYKPKPLLPALVIMGVEKSVDMSTFSEELIRLNSLPADSIKRFFIMNDHHNPNRKTQNIYIRVTPECFQAIAKLEFKLCIGFKECYLRRRILVDQCQHCFKVGHGTAHCPNKNNAPICATCGVQEEDHECSGTIKCYNCGKHPRFSKEDHNHRPNNMRCPLYRNRHDILEQRTQYHPSSD